MTAGLHTLHNDRVCPLFLHALGELHARHNGNDLYPRRVKLLKVRYGIARAERHKRRLFRTDHIHNLVLIRSHEHNVDAERPIRQRTAAANLVTRVLRRASAR